MSKSVIPEHLKVIEGGKLPVINPRVDPTDPFNGNWLDELDNGVVFVYREINKKTAIFLDHAFVVNNDIDHLTQLLFPTGEKKWVDSKNFSAQYDCLHWELLQQLET